MSGSLDSKVWVKGIGSDVSQQAGNQEICNRDDILRLLTVMLSKSMYCKANDLMSLDNPWAVEILAADPDLSYSLFCSLFNAILSYDPIGWASLPYKHVNDILTKLLFGDKQEELVINCIHTIVPLLDYQSHVTAPADGSLVAGSSSSSPPPYNAFRRYLKSITKAQDLQLILNGVVSLFRNPADVWLYADLGIQHILAGICKEAEHDF